MDDSYKQLGCQLTHGTQNMLRAFDGRTYQWHDGVWIGPQHFSEAQEQTRDSFAYKWQREETFTSDASLHRMRAWLIERYGDIRELIPEGKRDVLLLDAGCGAGMSALEFFAPCWPQCTYVGVDVSDAVHVARKRVLERGLTGIFFRESIMELPFAPQSVDMIFSEGVLHHTDSTRDALFALAPLLRPGGHMLFYVYNKKGPIREFTDDFIRGRLANMSPEEAWQAMEPLTRLGIEIGKHDIDIEIPEGIPLLDIPAGKVSLQRFLYWHVFKAFYDENLTLEEMNHINFDWYSPKNAHRQTPEDVKAWCRTAHLDIQRMVIEPAGITVIARKMS